MGFEVFQEDDITSELYAFDKLNFPPNHPARESMDTYWLEGHDSGATNEKLCLRPHLTGGSVRYMQTIALSIRDVSIETRPRTRTMREPSSSMRLL